LLQSDPKLVKIWNARGGSSPSSAWNQDPGVFGPSGSSTNDEGLGGPLGTTVANVEGTADFTHFITSGDSSDPSGQRHGLLLCAGEQSKVQSFYCPVLGAAPQWCTFLDNITEELEERDGALNNPSIGGVDADAAQIETVYEDYKFLTRAEIDKLGMQNLVGTPLLRGYMHGFFVHVGLYNRIRAVAKPFEYSEYRSRKIRERMEEKRASRIAPKVAPKAKAKVNPDLADRLRAKAGDKTKAGKVARALVEDDRFGRLFDNPDFEIDEEAEDFKLRNPSGIAAKRVRNDRDMDSDQEDDADEDDYDGEIIGGAGFNGVTNEKGNEGWGNGSDDDYERENSQESDSDDDGFMGGKVREIPMEEEKTKKYDKTDKKKKKKSKVVMHEADDYLGSGANAVDVGLGNVSAEDEANKRKKELSLTVEERLRLQSERSKLVGETKRFKVAGQGPIVKEVTFVPKSNKKKKAESEERTKREAGKDDRSGRNRRGVKSLGLKTPFKHHQ
jgi:ribosome biogenesis protein ENP2